MKNIKILFLLGCLLLGSLSCAYGNDSFIIQKIRPEGLRYIPIGTFLAHMPVKAGDRFDQSKSVDIIRDLYQSGFFDNVSIYREGNVLVVKVIERPIISAVKIAGNKKITTTQLDEALKQSGFVAGQILDNSLLSSFERSLRRQYNSLGHYDVKIAPKVIPQDQGRVKVDIIISEGPVAKIKEIKIIGNHKFKTKDLLKEFSLSTPGLLSWYTHDDQYSKEKLDADLAKLRAYYLDRGYLQFKIDSSEVSLTPDKKHVYIVIQITEGVSYTISGFNFSGNLLGQEEKLRKLVNLKNGEIFSRRKIMDIDQKMTIFLSDLGYAFVSVKPEIKVDNDAHQVYIDFMVIPGQKVYLRRLSFAGNVKTSESVLRREMRQIEGALFSGSKLEESRRRLYNLGYIKSAEPKVQPVEDRNNQVDVQYDIQEDDSASFGLNVGYSDVDHFIYGASLTDRNFMGSGKSVGLQFNNSNYNQIYSVNYYDPYFTENNVSFGASAYAKLTDQGDIDDTSNYTVDVTGITLRHGFPISEHSRISFGYGYDNTRIKVATDSPEEVLNFIDEYGRIFDLVKVYASWQYSNLDRYIFPREGFSQSLSVEASVPVFPRKADYYKVNYDARAYCPLLKYFVGTARVFLGGGDGYGNMSELPFFENYFGGGLGSVRGYKTSTLGPKDSYGRSIGGNISVYGGLGLVLPSPIDSLRSTLFFDVGNIYQTYGDDYNLDVKELRYSTGIQFEFHSVIPFTVSFGIPINKRPIDEKQVFQFTIALGL
jgi:outer membrane protein insertion porin family